MHKLTNLESVKPVLNSFAALETGERKWVRSILIGNITTAKSALFTNRELNEKAFIPLKDVEMHLPMRIGDYTDSFSSLIHAQNVRLAPLFSATVLWLLALGMGLILLSSCKFSHYSR